MAGERFKMRAGLISCIEARGAGAGPPLAPRERNLSAAYSAHASSWFSWICAPECQGLMICSIVQIE